MTFKQLTQARVLVVEDEPLVRWSIRKAIEDIGCFVVEAETCLAAEDSWKRDDFDVAVLDYRLPDGVSLEILQRLRIRGNKMPVIYLTAEADLIENRDLDRLGIVAVLRKPVNIQALRDAVAATVLSGADEIEIKKKDASIGGFTSFICPVTVDGAIVAKACEENEESAWIVFLMDETESITEEAIGFLRRNSDKRRLEGGRICLVVQDRRVRDFISGHGLDREVDVLSSIEELRHIRRKTTSPAERMSLMDVSINSVDELVGVSLEAGAKVRENEGHEKK